MKKLLCVFVYLIAFTAIMGGILTACADEPEEGAAKIVNELTEYSMAKETIGVKDHQKLIAYYRLPLASLFEDSDSIEEVLKSTSVWDIYYYVEQNGRIVESYVCKEGDITRMWACSPEAETIAVLLNEVLPKQLPDNAEVLDVYGLDGEAVHNGYALYVRTTVGDFVYYNYFLTSQVLGKQQTFFTGSEFFNLMRAVKKAEREAWGYTDGPNWLPIVIGAGVAVVAAGGAVGIIIYKKKKKAKGNAEAEVPTHETNS